MSGLTKNVIILGALLINSVLCAMAAPVLVNARGNIGPSIVLSQSPLIAAIVVIACLGGAAVVSGIAGRFTSAAVGMFCVGWGAFVLAGRTGTIREIAFGEHAASRGPLILLAAESLLWAGGLLLATLAVFRIAGPLRDISADDQGSTPHPLFSERALQAALAGLVIIPGLWLLGQSPMKGQMIGSIFLASMVVGLAGRLISPHVQPLLLFVAPITFAAVGQLIGAMVMHQPIDHALVLRTLWPLNLATPVDLAAGSLTGVAVGLGWARSFLHHDEHAAAITT